jgi:hypothetical protein
MGLPIRPFLYTIDQIASLLELSVPVVKQQYLHYEGRQVGVRAYAKMRAHNIAPDGEKPEWRVTEEELIRWLRFKGFKIYVRGFARS